MTRKRVNLVGCLGRMGRRRVMKTMRMASLVGRTRKGVLKL